MKKFRHTKESLIDYPYKSSYTRSFLKKHLIPEDVDEMMEYVNYIKYFENQGMKEKSQAIRFKVWLRDKKLEKLFNE